MFDLDADRDVYFCSADVGWITGHSYIVYGPLANGATSVMYEGAPDYPHKRIWWELIERYGVSIFYTAPTAIRACMKWGAEHPNAHDLSSLRLLGTVGEPINPKAWLWYHVVIGRERCPIVDTWWQTETGQIMISPLPGVTVTKPGSATHPLPGVAADVLDERTGERVEQGQGLLVLKRPWPAMLRTLYGDDERYVETYWSRFGPQTYLVGDAAIRDKDGYLWIVGRIDDVINVSGHRLSTAEVESAIVAHEKVAEAAVVAQSDELTGQAIVAFVTLQGDLEGSRRDRASNPRTHRSTDRQARPPQTDPLGRRPAQDPLGKDHAPPAQGHRRRSRARRRHHPARPGRDGRTASQGRRRTGQGALRRWATTTRRRTPRHPTSIRRLRRDQRDEVRTRTPRHRAHQAQGDRYGNSSRRRILGRGRARRDERPRAGLRRACARA